MLIYSTCEIQISLAVEKNPCNSPCNIHVSYDHLVLILKLINVYLMIFELSNFSIFNMYIILFSIYFFLNYPHLATRTLFWSQNPIEIKVKYPSIFDINLLTCWTSWNTQMIEKKLIRSQFFVSQGSEFHKIWIFTLLFRETSTS